MSKVDFYTIKGVKKEARALPKEFLGEIRLGLLAQAIHVYQDRLHKGLARTKTRGEVKISKRKIYRQKGTGGARHGARSAPLFVGGGIAHGPKGIKKVLTLPEKMKRKALEAAISFKAKSGEIKVIDDLSSLKKTKEVGELLSKLELKKKRVTFVTQEKKEEFMKASRNLGNADIKTFRSLNAYDVFYGGTIVLDGEIIARDKETKTREKNK